MRKLYLFFLFILSSSLYSENWDKVHYSFTSDPIDVVIPCVEKDLPTLEYCIQGIRKYGENIRRIIVVSKKKLTNSAEWFDESNYPFSKEDLAFEIFQNNELEAKQYLNSPQNRIGWIFQQFLKFYSQYTIPDISPNVLVLDSDMIFLNKTKFMSAIGEPYFDFAEENHAQYFEQASRLLPDFKRVDTKRSGIVNHMLFQKVVLDDFFQMIEKIHQIEAWKAIARCMDSKNLSGPCLSEYELYFNFIQSRTDQAVIRKLSSRGLLNLQHISVFKALKFNYVFSHEWARKTIGGMSY